MFILNALIFKRVQPVIDIKAFQTIQRTVFRKVSTIIIQWYKSKGPDSHTMHSNQAQRSLQFSVLSVIEIKSTVVYLIP